MTGFARQYPTWLRNLWETIQPISPQTTGDQTLLGLTCTTVMGWPVHPAISAANVTPTRAAMFYPIAPGSADRTVSLYSAAGHNDVLRFKKIDNAGHNILFLAAASESVEGTANPSTWTGITTQNQVVTLQADGVSVWYVIGN
jgi:hypothetical protein